MFPQNQLTSTIGMMNQPLNLLVDSDSFGAGQSGAIAEQVIEGYPQYPIVQINGQRKFGPPINWPAHVPPPDPKQCEVFVGSLPRECTLHQLVPHFMTVGPIFQMRLMMDFSGTNRGYAFVTYCKPEDAVKACELLNNSLIGGKAIGVVQSLDNSRLYIGGIPLDKTEEDLKMELENRGVQGVVHINMIFNPSMGQRKVAFVEFKDHYSAAMARRELLPADIPLWNDPHVRIDWAKPKPGPSQAPRRRQH